MPPIRVTVMINSLTQGGAERQALELIRGLDRERFTPSLLTCTAVDQLNYDLQGVELRRISSVVAVQELRAALNGLGTEILHTYMGLPNLVGRWVGHRAGVRVVSSVRNTQLPRRYIWSDRWTHRWGDALIVNSVGIRDELVRRAKVPPHAIDVIENGVDVERFVPLSEDTIARERSMWGFDGRIVIVFPARLSRQKNHIGLFRAIARLKSSGRWPARALVVLAGRSSPPWVGPMVHGMAASLGLGPREVEFAGVVRAVETLVGISDATILPSHHEGLPNVVLESMACGVPVIVSPPANVDRLIRHTVEGLETASTEPEALADGLEQLFSMSERERREMGERGRSRAESHYSVARMIDRTMQVYERLMSPAGPRFNPRARLAKR